MIGIVVFFIMAWLAFFQGYWFVAVAYIAVLFVAACLENGRKRRVWQNLNRYG